jgi:1-acyl-sn-glycerol-3-phosphate acyltransferase
VPDLYDAVARGMWAYSHGAFRTETLGTDRFRLEPGTLVVAPHRHETDVPILSSALYFAGDLRRNPSDRMHFSARDDMFIPGFFAGFPKGLPARVRRLLYPIDVARGLATVQVHPIRSASVARLGEVFRAHPERPLNELLPNSVATELRGRASVLGLAPPERAGDVLRGEYADLLWRAVGPHDLPRDELAPFWGARAAQAARDFRALVELLRSQGTLVVYPEGRPSPDGEIGPLRPGIGALLRRGRPRWIRPLGLAYDPLVRGRTRVWVAFPMPVPPPEDDAEASLLRLLRGSIPLTAGQFAAHRLQAGAAADPAALERELAEAVESALADRRPVERELLEQRGRQSRLAEALAVAPRKPEALPFLAREYESARDTVPAGGRRK